MSNRRAFAFIFFLFLSNVLLAQTLKTVHRNSHAWLSFNSTTKVTNKIGLVADIHVRRNNFLADPNFYFVRGAVNYHLSDKLSVASGYAHMWVAPAMGMKTYADEHWFYQQMQYTSKFGKFSLTQRLRNEMRWQEIIVEDHNTNRYKFNNRVCLLGSLNFKVFKADKLPSLCLSNELLFQFGKKVIYNTFDQNWLFIGAKQKVSKDLGFDIGYLMVYQQKSAGYVYDVNNTFRCFFYYTPDLRKKR